MKILIGFLLVVLLMAILFVPKIKLADSDMEDWQP